MLAQSAAENPSPWIPIILVAFLVGAVAYGYWKKRRNGR